MSVHEANIEVLSNAGFGTLLLDAYQASVVQDSRVSQAEILARPPHANPLAEAAPSCFSVTGKHRVFMALGDAPTVLDRYDKSLGAIHGARKFFAERLGLGLAVADITPTFLVVSSLIHEFGHVLQFMNSSGDRDFWPRSFREKSAMPLGNVAVSALLDPNSEQRQRVDANLDALLRTHGAASLHELLGIQHEAYRMTTEERTADLFSASVLRANPKLLRTITR